MAALCGRNAARRSCESSPATCRHLFLLLISHKPSLANPSYPLGRAFGERVRYPRKRTSLSPTSKSVRCFGTWRSRCQGVPREIKPRGEWSSCIQRRLTCPLPPLPSFLFRPLWSIATRETKGSRRVSLALSMGGMAQDRQAHALSAQILRCSPGSACRSRWCGPQTGL